MDNKNNNNSSGESDNNNTNSITMQQLEPEPMQQQQVIPIPPENAMIDENGGDQNEKMMNINDDNSENTNTNTNTTPTTSNANANDNDKDTDDATTTTTNTTSTSNTYTSIQTPAFPSVNLTAGLNIHSLPPAHHSSNSRFLTLQEGDESKDDYVLRTADIQLGDQPESITYSQFNTGMEIENEINRVEDDEVAKEGSHAEVILPEIMVKEEKPKVVRAIPARLTFDLDSSIEGVATLISYLLLFGYASGAHKEPRDLFQAKLTPNPASLSKIVSSSLLTSSAHSFASPPSHSSSAPVRSSSSTFPTSLTSSSSQFTCKLPKDSTSWSLNSLLLLIAPYVSAEEYLVPPFPPAFYSFLSSNRQKLNLKISNTLLQSYEYRQITSRPSTSKSPSYSNPPLPPWILSRLPTISTYSASTSDRRFALAAFDVYGDSNSSVAEDPDKQISNHKDPHKLCSLPLRSSGWSRLHMHGVSSSALTTFLLSVPDYKRFCLKVPNDTVVYVSFADAMTLTLEYLESYRLTASRRVHIDRPVEPSQSNQSEINSVLPTQVSSENGITKSRQKSNIFLIPANCLLLPIIKKQTFTIHELHNHIAEHISEIHPLPIHSDSRESASLAPLSFGASACHTSTTSQSKLKGLQSKELPSAILNIFENLRSLSATSQKKESTSSSIVFLDDLRSARNLSFWASKSPSKSSSKRKRGTNSPTKKNSLNAASKSTNKKLEAKLTRLQLSASEKEAKRRGFMAVMKLSPTLSELLHYRYLPRPLVVRQVWKYIKRCNLQLPTDRRIIAVDATLQKIMPGAEQVTMTQMNRFLTPHLTKVPRESEEFSIAQKESREAEEKIDQEMLQELQSKHGDTDLLPEFGDDIEMIAAISDTQTDSDMDDVDDDTKKKMDRKMKVESLQPVPLGSLSGESSHTVKKKPGPKPKPEDSSERNQPPNKRIRREYKRKPAPTNNISNVNSSILRVQNEGEAEQIHLATEVQLATEIIPPTKRGRGRPKRNLDTLPNPKTVPVPALTPMPIPLKDASSSSASESENRSESESDSDSITPSDEDSEDDRSRTDSQSSSEDESDGSSSSSGSENESSEDEEQSDYCSDSSSSND